MGTPHEGPKLESPARSKGLKPGWPPTCLFRDSWTFAEQFQEPQVSMKFLEFKKGVCLPQMATEVKSHTGLPQRRAEIPRQATICKSVVETLVTHKISCCLMVSNALSGVFYSQLLCFSILGYSIKASDVKTCLARYENGAHNVTVVRLSAAELVEVSR